MDARSVDITAVVKIIIIALLVAHVHKLMAHINKIIDVLFLPFHSNPS